MAACFISILCGYFDLFIKLRNQNYIKDFYLYFTDTNEFGLTCYKLVFF